MKNALAIQQHLKKLILGFLFALSFLYTGQQSTALAQANCAPPNLLMILDRSCSMGNSTSYITTTRTCTNNNSCNPMLRTYQPTPGTTTRYNATCTGNRCRYTRWDLAQNALKEVTYQYGGTPSKLYADAKIRFGLEYFSDQGQIAAPVVSTPAVISTSLTNTNAGGGTYYIRAFTVARAELQRTVNADTVKKRPSHILFITDGDSSDSCATTVAMVRDLYNGTGTNRLVDNANNIYNVKTYVIGFGTGLTAKGQKCLNDIAAAGGTQRCNPAVAGCVAYYFADNDAQLSAAMKSIIDNATQEVCDGIDNDCNGKTDDDPQGNPLAQSCYTGPTGTRGQGICKAGIQQCTGGKWGACVGQVLPKAEICDGLDNNCNRTTDETWTQKGKACTAGSGSCVTNGTWVCKADKTGIECNAKPAGNGTPEVCDGKDNDCNGKIDENLIQNCYTGPAGTRGKGECRAGIQSCSAGKWGTCTKEIQPKAEICDGKDNDCDGSIDEGISRTCYSGAAGTEGKGACKAGKQICSAGKFGACIGEVVPAKEICDGKDNNCDGSIDEKLTQACKTDCGSGQEACTGGKWTGCTAPKPQKEQCNGKDDDCNGKIDDINCTCKDGDKRACYTGPAGSEGKGICKGGSETCVGGKWSGTCVGEVKPAAKEICNNKQDDDCNGKTDEGCEEFCVKGKTRACSTPCGQGTQSCVQDRWGACEGAPKPDFEVCDGKDNDCDGLTDENLLRTCKTPCGDGIETCTNGAWGTCQGRQPTAEVCDGIDNNCDGKTDENAKCPNGSPCVEGACLSTCSGGECAKGQLCKDGFCQPKTTCAQITCPSGQICVAGTCSDPCAKLTCGAGQVCFAGTCKSADCYALGCPSGQVCLQGQCISNPCANKTCPSGEYCSNGQCVKSCAAVQCKAGEACKEGVCTADPCANVSCDKGKSCIAGDCKTDPCDQRSCPIGRSCINGECKDDPCATVQCNNGNVCQLGQCVDACKTKKCAAGEVCKLGQCLKDDCYNRGCPSGQACKAGQCVDDPCAKTTCPSGEFCKEGKCIKSCATAKCKAEETCKEGVCIADPCLNAGCKGDEICKEGKCIQNKCTSNSCEKGRVCNPEDGKCIDDPCLNIKCEADAKCAAGECIDACNNINCPDKWNCQGGVCVQKNCYTEGCPDGQICNNRLCTADPCKDKTCASGEFCRDGKCIKSCAEVKCKTDEHCIDGACIADPCANKNCAAGEVCVKGACKSNPCDNVSCGPGRFCNPLSGQCEDAPCNNIKCPGDQSCKEGQCVKKDPNNPAEGNPGDGNTGDGDPSKGEKGNTELGPKVQEQIIGESYDGGQSDFKRTPPGCQCSNSTSPWSPLSFGLFALLFFFFSSLRRKH